MCRELTAQKWFFVFLFFYHMQNDINPLNLSPNISRPTQAVATTVVTQVPLLVPPVPIDPLPDVHFPTLHPSTRLPQAFLQVLRRILTLAHEPVNRNHPALFTLFLCTICPPLP